MSNLQQERTFWFITTESLLKFACESVWITFKSNHYSSFTSLNETGFQKGFAPLFNGIFSAICLLHIEGNLIPNRICITTYLKLESIHMAYAHINPSFWLHKRWKINWSATIWKGTSSLTALSTMISLLGRLNTSEEWRSHDT